MDQAQFDKVGGDYTSFVTEDPVRNHLHYHNVIMQISKPRSDVLDIGCGDGLFARRLVKEQGAKVLGYDRAPNLIQIAIAIEANEKQGIEYLVAEPTNFVPPRYFDYATSVMVLPYAPDAEYLCEFFRSANESLKPNGRFISIVFRPDFDKFETPMVNRRFEKKDDENAVVHFLGGDGQDKFTADYRLFAKDDYQAAAEKAGFRSVEWSTMLPSFLSIRELGMGYWGPCIDNQPYSLMIARK